MTVLHMIQEFAQQTVSAIAEVLGVEVIIVDEEVRVVAGTGGYNDEINQCLGPNTVCARVIESKQRLTIANPRVNEVCQNCFRRPICTDAAEICFPIVVGNEVIGVLGLLAFNEEQKNTLLGQEDKLLNFVARISDLFSSVISARQLTDKINDMATEYKTVVNSINDGIIAIDKLGRIQQVNGPAEKMLKRAQQDLIGSVAADIFLDQRVINALKQNTVFIGKEIVAKVAGRKHYFLANMTHISGKSSQGLKGHVLVIRNSSEVSQIVGNYLMNERSVHFDDIKCVSAAMLTLKDKALQVSQSDSTVLIQGESGTGKEMFARAIHSASFRADGPFVAINCGAIPEALLESELFGYEEGAFSGAKRGGKAGRLELANNGTIFLDEIGDLPLHLQVKLLRIFENKTVDRLGGVRPTPVDVRIIAATHRDLPRMVERGEFREDLYYRLSVIPLFIPPLRERREDVRIYVDFFIRRFGAAMGKQVEGCSAPALDKLLQWNWPGNIRELENTIEYAVNIEHAKLIQLASLPGRILQEDLKEKEAGADILLPLTEMEKQQMIRALNKYGSSPEGKETICQVLGIGIATFYRKAKTYGIDLGMYR